MRNPRKSVYLLMAMVVLSSPLLACTVPGLAMSEEEKECCRHMADQCGSMQMEESHSCCTKTRNISAGALQATDKYSLPALPDCASQAAPDMAPDFGPCAGISVVALKHCESPPGHISVLRI